MKRSKFDKNIYKINSKQSEENKKMSLSGIQQLLAQNKRLKEIMSNCEEQVMELKQIGQDHEAEIDSLLKFNERLLAIIENEMPNKMISKSSSGSNLMPIEEDNVDIENDPKSPTYIDSLKQHRIEPRQEDEKMRGEGEDGKGNDKGQKWQNENDEEFYDSLCMEEKKHLQSPGTSQTKQPNSTHSQIKMNKVEVQQQDGQQIQQKLQNQQKISITQATKSNEKYITPSPSPSYYNINSNEYPEGIIIKEEKESLISIPTLFKLNKGLNDHYTKELFLSIEQKAVEGHKWNTNGDKGEIINQISETVTERLDIAEEELTTESASIMRLIEEYREDCNPNEYEHICGIIKKDLETDLTELNAINQESLGLYQEKTEELNRLRSKIQSFSPIQQLIKIMGNLETSKPTQNLLYQKIIRKNGYSSTKKLSSQAMQLKGQNRHK